jgi:ubiquinone/menaquinone biosynthesis C-methylase UbiE
MSKAQLLQEKLEELRRDFLKYTKKAFRTLPHLDKPRILDVGCGSGTPTIELANASHGEIIGIDIDPAPLKKLNQKIADQGLAPRVKAINTSLLSLDFPEESFDLIWAEGVLGHIGYQKSLKASHRLLKPAGFLVNHDAVSQFDPLAKESAKLARYGFTLYRTFPLPEGAWWIEFYAPLERWMNQLEGPPDAASRALFEQYRREIAMVKKNPTAFDCAFYVLQKR